MISVTRDCEQVVLTCYNPYVSLRMSAKEAHTLRDCIEVAIMDYDARQESGAQPPQADNSDYAAALKVYLEWVGCVSENGVFVSAFDFHTWLNQRLNSSTSCA